MLKALSKLKTQRRQLEAEEQKKEQTVWQRYAKLLRIENPTENELNDIAEVARELNLSDGAVELHAAALAEHDKLSIYVDEHIEGAITRRKKVEAEMRENQQKISELREANEQLGREARQHNQHHINALNRRNKMQQIERTFAQLFGRERDTPVTSRELMRLPNKLNHLACDCGLVNEAATTPRDRDVAGIVGDRDFEHRQATATTDE